MRLAAALAGLGLLAQAGPAPHGPPGMLPPVALEAAALGVVPLAYVLARANVPAGIVTSQNPSDFAFARAGSGFDAARTVPLADVLARLQASHPSYRTEWRDGVLGLVQTDAECAVATRDVQVGPMTYSGDVSKVMVFLTWLVRGQVGQPRGTTGSVLGNLDDLGKALPTAPYELKQPTPMQAAFDKVVRAQQGGVWFVWQHLRADKRIGCRSVAYWPNGLVTAPEEDFYIK